VARARSTVLLWVALALAFCVSASPAEAGPPATRIASAPGTIVPIPAAIPHEDGDMVDRRILPDLRWIARHFPIYVTDGYSGPLPNGEHAGCHGCHVRHSDHYNGLAVDIVPLTWSEKCDRHWRGITRLARWAEPRQNQPAPPFRWVGYDGDAGHGCGNHLHLSWEHAAAPRFELAEWVEVFPVRNQGLVRSPKPYSKRARPPRGLAPPAGPPGGVSAVETGGVSSRGD
jgi:hypothetical protein